MDLNRSVYQNVAKPEGPRPAQDVEHGAQQQAYLGPTGPTLYEYHDRPRRDTWAMIAYLSLLFIATIGGIASFATTNHDAFNGQYSPAFYRNSTSCSLSSFQASQGSAVDTSVTFGSSFTVSVSIWLPITIIFGIIFSVIYLYLFRNHAVMMVYASVIASVTISIVIAVVAFAAGAVAGGVILLIFAVISAGIFWWIRDQLKMCGQVMAVAGRGLQDCPGIIISALCMKFIGIGIMAFYFAALICAVFVGKVEPSGYRDFVKTINGDVGICYATDLSGIQYPVDCCTYITATWAGVYCFFAAFALTWTAQVLLSLKLYVVADTLAQWYFQPAGNMDPRYQPSVMIALRHGLTSSFGSICFAGLILTIIKILREAMNKAQHSAEGIMKIICCFLNCIAQCLLELVEQFTHFATVATAISGKGFVPAAKDLFDMLKRNFLATYSLWWIPDFTLGMTVFLFTLAWSCLVFFVTYLQWKDSGNAVGLAFAVSSVAFASMGFILYFVSSLMLDGVNAIYICFAFDRDRKVVSHPEIHQVYEAIPSLSGALIQQPDGGVAYGAPSSSAHVPGYGSQPNYGAPHSYAGGSSGTVAPPMYGHPSYGGQPQQMYQQQVQMQSIPQGPYGGK